MLHNGSVQGQEDPSRMNHQEQRTAMLSICNAGAATLAWLGTFEQQLDKETNIYLLLQSACHRHQAKLTML